MPVTEEQISGWVAGKQEEAAYFLMYLENTGLDDTSGAGKILCSYLSAQNDIRNARGFLLTGAAGCGRHTAAYHAVQYLKQELGFEAVFLSGEELSFPDSPEDVIPQHCNALLDACDDQGKDLCLVIDRPEQCARAEELFRFLGQTAFKYAIFEEWRNLFLILIAEKEDRIPALLRERLFLYRCAPPDKEKRLHFLENYAPSVYDELDTEKNLEAFSAVTEGCTYAKLRDIAQAADFYLRAQESEVIEGLPEFIREQAQQNHSGGIPERLLPVLDMLPDILQKCSQFVDSLPELLARLPAGGTVVRTEPEQKPAAETDPRAAFEKEIANKTTYEIAADLFGKEATDSLLNVEQEQEQTA